MTASVLVAAAAFAPAAPLFLAQATGDLRHWAVAGRRGVDLLGVLALPLGAWGFLLAIPLIAAGAWAAWGATGSAEAAPVRHTLPSSPRPAFVLLMSGAVGCNVLGWLAQHAGVGARLEPPYLAGAATWALLVLGLGVARAPAAIRACWRRPAEPGAAEPAGARPRWPVHALVMVALVSQVAAWQAWLPPRSPMPSLAAVVGAMGRPGDLVVISPASLAPTFSFYYPGPLEQWAPPFRQRVTRVPWIGLLGRMEDEAVRRELIRDLAGHLETGGRVWLVAGGALPLEAPMEVAASFAAARTPYEYALWSLHGAVHEALGSAGRRVPLSGVRDGRGNWEPAALALYQRADRGAEE